MPTVLLGALQPLSPVYRVAERWRHDPVRRNAHFLKYNTTPVTYDAVYARAYGEEYFRYLAVWLYRAAGKGVNLLLLPEVIFTPAVMSASAPELERNPRAFADLVEMYAWSEGFFLDRAGWIARETGMQIAASIPTTRDGKVYNAGIILDETGHEAGRYDKVHLAPGDEEDLYTPGPGYPVIETSLGRFGFAICYDIQFPEATACLAMEGVQVILHPSNGYTLPDEEQGLGQYRLRIRASDHYCALVYSSFAPGPRRNAPGESAVIAQNGDVLGMVRGQRTGLALGQVEIGRKRAWPFDGPDDPDRRTFVRARRRPETYGPLLRTS